MTANDKATATVLLKDGNSVITGYYRVKITHLPKYAMRVVLGGVVLGLGLVLSLIFGGPSWLNDVLYYQLAWLALELIAAIGLMAARAKNE